jgi:hypothetical protein
MSFFSVACVFFSLINSSYIAFALFSDEIEKNYPFLREIAVLYGSTNLLSINYEKSWINVCVWERETEREREREDREMYLTHRNIAEKRVVQSWRKCGWKTIRRLKAISVILISEQVTSLLLSWHLCNGVACEYQSQIGNAK